jgi:hypothetical protein
MTTREILKYAKDNGYDSTMFSLKSSEGKPLCVGKFLDAYYEFVQLPICGTGFITLSDLEDRFGYNLSFEVIDETQYNICVYMDFLLRGIDIPEDIKKNFEKVGQEA